MIWLTKEDLARAAAWVTHPLVGFQYEWRNTPIPEPLPDTYREALTRGRLVFGELSNVAHGTLGYAANHLAERGFMKREMIADSLEARYTITEAGKRLLAA